MENKKKLETRKMHLEAIIKDNKLKGFSMEGSTQYFDGDEWSSSEKYLISAAGKDAPDVYTIKIMGETQRKSIHGLKEHIIAGENTVKQKAYSLALENGKLEIESWNKYAKRYNKSEKNKYGLLIRELIDNGKDFLDYEIE